MLVVFGISELLKRNSGNAAQQLHTVMINWCKCSGVMCKWHTENEHGNHLWYLVSELPQQSITLFCYWAVNLNCIHGSWDWKWSRHTERVRMYSSQYPSLIFSHLLFSDFFHYYVFVILQLFSWFISTYFTNLQIFSFAFADFITEMSHF